MTEATLKTSEIHPMTHSALVYIRMHISALDVEAMASCAIEGNRAADICLSTYNRLQNMEPVSDRYLLGLAWFIKELRDG